MFHYFMNVLGLLGVAVCGGYATVHALRDPLEPWAVRALNALVVLLSLVVWYAVWYAVPFNGGGR